MPEREIEERRGGGGREGSLEWRHFYIQVESAICPARSRAFEYVEILILGNQGKLQKMVNINALCPGLPLCRTGSRRMIRYRREGDGLLRIFLSAASSLGL